MYLFFFLILRTPYASHWCEKINLFFFLILRTPYASHWCEKIKNARVKQA